MADLLTPDPRWRTLPTDAKRCRYTHCPCMAVAELYRPRGSGGQWWAYCERHMQSYGRVIVAGEVMLRGSDSAVSLGTGA